MSGIKKLIEQTAIYGISSIVGRLLNFLLVPLYTGIFNPEQYGTLSLLMTLVAFSMVVLTYGFETAFFHFISKEENKSKVFSTGMISLFVSTGLFLFLVNFNFEAIASILTIQNQAVFVKYLAWVLALDVMATLPFANLRQLNKAWKFAGIRLANIGVNIGLNLFFYLVCPWLLAQNIAAEYISLIYSSDVGIGYIFISYLISSAITLVLLTPTIFRTALIFDYATWKRMLSYGFPLLVGGLAYVTNEMADKLLLEFLLPSNISKSEIGIYSACYKIAIFMTLFIQAFRYGAEPYFFNKSKDEDAQNHYARIMGYFIAFTGFIFLSVNLFIDVIKHFLRDESYHQGLEVVPILLFANLLLGIYFNLSVWYKVTGNTRFGAYISLIGALVTISLNLALIPTFSYVGSAWATLACYTIMCVISYAYSRKYYPIPYSWKEIFYYLATAIGLYLLWKFKHDDYFILSGLYCIIYIFVVLALEKRKKRRIFNH